MIDELQVEKYKCLDRFQMEGLSQVNLITGRNSSGKSTILEALMLLAEGGSAERIAQLLTQHDEYQRLRSEKLNRAEEYLQEVFSSLFTDRHIGYKEEDAFRISAGKYRLSFRLVCFTEVPIADDELMRTKKILQEAPTDDSRYGYEVKTAQSEQLVSLYSLSKRNRFHTHFETLGGGGVNIQFINASGRELESDENLWDEITLSTKEELVVEALRIIEPDIERIAFVGREQRSYERYPLALLKSSGQKYPLKAMGDGISRILNIVLALVNADHGFLLIDEIENGLHHTVQEKLWELIFTTTAKLNTQVFATTHSEDSIRAFSRVLQTRNELDGRLFRIDRASEGVKAYAFGRDELSLATEHGLNLR